MRDDETAAVLGVESGALVVTGEPGSGKSTLLSLAAAQSSRLVLSTSGVPSETNLPFAGLHHLLSGADLASPDRLFVGLGVLSLLSSLAPVLVVVDDVQWLDRESRDALVFAGRRIFDEQVTLLMASREAVPGLPSVRLAPLSAHEANWLLDQQPRPPRGQRRMRILTQAAGNPLALIELSRVESGDEPLVPLTERLESLFAAELRALPEACRYALLLAAASETPSAGRSPRAGAENVRPFWQSENRGSPWAGDSAAAVGGSGVGRGWLGKKRGAIKASAAADPGIVSPHQRSEPSHVRPAIAELGTDGPHWQGEPSQAGPAIAEPGTDGSHRQREPLQARPAIAEPGTVDADRRSEPPQAGPAIAEPDGLHRQSEPPQVKPAIADLGTNGPHQQSAAPQAGPAIAGPGTDGSHRQDAAPHAGPTIAGPGTVRPVWENENRGSPAPGDLFAPLRADDLAPAERAGLIRVTAGRVHFRHPLVRAAAYHSAPLATRRQAHRELAQATTGDRRAWHRAAAADQRDEDVAADLERTATQAWQTGGYAAAATALERAAELSPAPYDAARRLVLAADVAVLTGQAHWVDHLAAKVDGLTTDRTLRAKAALRRGQARALTTGHTEALELLREAAREPEIAHLARTTAAAAAFYAGDTGRLDHDDDPWIKAVLNPHRDRDELTKALSTLENHDRTAVGAMAWLLDETREAVRIFDDALHRWRASGQLPSGLGCGAGWAYLDHGRWAQARLAAEGAKQFAAEAGLDHLGAAAKVLDAGVDALTGNIGKARDQIARALTEIDPWRSRAIGVRARWVLGMAAVAKGDHESAWEQFRLQFTADGEPVHYFWSYHALGELGAAAARVGKHQEAREIVQRAQKQVESPRLHALIHRAKALLSTEESHFHHAVDGTEQWPFERAQALLDFGEWLRRERRIVEARPLLTEAKNLFRALGAEPWTHRAQAELRAAGAEPEPVTPHALNTLSPQQQQIVRLAARGLSNREIGERMFLSPKTVASHLYRSYPKLGVTGRAQLRDLVDPPPAPADPAAAATAPPHP
ncbi:hypothetical protein Lesp02_06650 [Lentzea sp. NBRC 105346]|uniref:helix-turn-helix transcriptional regulator n=1 Tax=Lentzea sp. NBRC 105346 TaxID=3032205 RepID=UPI0024A5EB1C|nr:LuxR C-terminal-related transcriptional regulator [Lentzea sp. NBRC 105346]GLZ28475.1 hypothetical protein Lesp02_06650 [Lentzea sp. NBRC 105346]